MNIIYVYYHLAYTGGVVRVLTDKMNYLSENGCKITLVTYEQGNHNMSFPLISNITHIDTNTRFFTLHQLPIWKRIFVLQRRKMELRKRLQNIVNEIKPDIIIAIAGDQPACEAITKIDTDAILLLESHSINFETMNGINKERKSIFYRMYEHLCKKNISKFDALVALTNGSAAEWKLIIPNVYIIPNPITKYPEDIKKQSTNNRIIAVGRLDYEKGFDRLISAFSIISKQIPQWHLDIFGEGGEKKKLLSLISSYSLDDQIKISKPTPNIYKEYIESDFCVVSSYYEGWGLVILEAMSCGTPCVSFNCKYGPGDIIEHHVNGLLAEDGNIHDLAYNILWMCNHNKERSEMGRNARIHSTNYRIDKIMPMWIKLFSNLLKKKLNKIQDNRNSNL